MADEDDFETPQDRPSKSQVKRDLAVLRNLGEKLLEVPEDQLSRLDDEDLVNAILECKKITKGNARKRQLQYIGKLLRAGNPGNAQRLVDRFDASSRAFTEQFHQLERWRERLIDEDADAVAEVIAAYPNIDRQHFRQLVRNAVNERKKEREPPVHYRKLFQYLKFLSE